MNDKLKIALQKTLNHWEKILTYITTTKDLPKYKDSKNYNPRFAKDFYFDFTKIKTIIDSKITNLEKSCFLCDYIIINYREYQDILSDDQICLLFCPIAKISKKPCWVLGGVYNNFIKSKNKDGLIKNAKKIIHIIKNVK